MIIYIIVINYVSASSNSSDFYMNTHANSVFHFVTEYSFASCSCASLMTHTGHERRKDFEGQFSASI